MLVARRLQEQGLLPAGEHADAGFDQLIEAEFKRRRLRLSASQRRLIGIGGHLTYSALLGVIYGVARTRPHVPTAAKNALASGLALAAEAPSRLLTPPRNRRKSASRKKQVQRLEQTVIPIGAQMVFGIATTLVFKLLARGYYLE